MNPAGYERSVSGAFWHINKTSRKVKVPLISVFTGWVYGPDGWFESLARGIKNGTFSIVGDGRNYKSMINIDDLAEAYLKIAEKMQLGSRYCIVDGAPVTQKRLADYMADIMGAARPESVPPERYARRAGELAAEEMSCSVRVSGEWMKKSLLETLRYPSCKEGVPATLKAMGLAERTPVRMKEAAGF